jgi:hypothetical protein
VIHSQALRVTGLNAVVNVCENCLGLLVDDLNLTFVDNDRNLTNGRVGICVKHQKERSFVERLNLHPNDECGLDQFVTIKITNLFVKLDLLIGDAFAGAVPAEKVVGREDLFN